MTKKIIEKFFEASANQETTDETILIFSTQMMESEKQELKNYNVMLRKYFTAAHSEQLGFVDHDNEHKELITFCKSFNNFEAKINFVLERLKVLQEELSINQSKNADKLAQVNLLALLFNYLANAVGMRDKIKKPSAQNLTQLREASENSVSTHRATLYGSKSAAGIKEHHFDPETRLKEIREFQKEKNRQTGADRQPFRSRG